MPEGKCTFVHLSDIHFIRGFSDESKFDLDVAVRNAILDDAAKNFSSRLAPIHGVLITGDIAFAGKTEEYNTAVAWLSKLCNKLDCDKGYVWCVPGNHDVDQDVLKEFTAIPALHEQLRRSHDLDQDTLNSKLREHLENENTGPILFAPMRAYNENIGQRFHSLTMPKEPWWEDEFELNDSSKLRIRGLNSVLVSGPNDDKKNNMLLLGSAQTEHGRYDGVEFLTMCHHPMDWLLDGECSQEALLAYSRIQLFGHKHVQSLTEINNTLWLCAGAVHPIRKEKEWLPRYNYLSIYVEGTGTDRYLCVDVYARVWNQTDRLFIPEQTSFNSDPKTYRLKLQEWSPPMVENEKNESRGCDSELDLQASRTNLTLNRKKLLYRFIGLPHHVRMAIMKKYGLMEPEDDTRPISEVFGACFERARAKGVLDDVWTDIESQQEELK